MKTSVTPAHGRLFQARGVAEYLGITVSKARRLIASGELVAVRTAQGRLTGVYECDCDAWVNAHRRPTPTVNPRQLAVDDRMRHLMPKHPMFT